MEVCTVLEITGRLDTMEWLLGAISLVDPERWESQGKVILGGRMSKHRRDQKKTRWLKEVRAQHGSIGVTECLELSTAKAQVWETDVGVTVFCFFFKTLSHFDHGLLNFQFYFIPHIHDPRFPRFHFTPAQTQQETSAKSTHHMIPWYACGEPGYHVTAPRAH